MKSSKSKNIDKILLATYFSAKNQNKSELDARNFAINLFTHLNNNITRVKAIKKIDTLINNHKVHMKNCDYALCHDCLKNKKGCFNEINDKE